MRGRVYGDWGTKSTDSIAMQLVNHCLEHVYGIPNLDLESWGFFTDKAPAVSMRGVG